MHDTRPSGDAHREVAASMRPASGAAARARAASARAARPSGVRVALIVGVIVLVTALIGAGMLKVVDHFRPTGSSVAAPPLLRLAPLADGLKCVTLVAWSPDGSHLAALGNTQTCGASSLYAQSTRILIYDAHSGQISQQLQPDIDVVTSTDVRQALYDNWDDPHAIPQLTYSNLIWTPDGAALLLPFELHVSGVSHPDDKPMQGLLREPMTPNTDAPDAFTFVWLNRLWSPHANALELWDLSLAYPADAPTPTTGLRPPVGPQPVARVAPTPGETYRWGASGALSSSAEPATGAVGAPSGGQRFTIWQAGSLSYLPPSAVGGPAVVWTAKIAPVSPDGRYFYSSVPASGALVLSGAAGAGGSLNTLAPHDQALQALAQRLGQVAASDATTPLLVSWRPDGRLLAAVSETPATSAGALTVSIYDTATGALVKQFTPDFDGLTAGPVGAETLQWAPNGQQLLFSDGAYGSLTLWGPGELPK